MSEYYWGVLFPCIVLHVIFIYGHVHRHDPFPCCVIFFTCQRLWSTINICGGNYFLTELLKLERACFYKYTMGTLTNSTFMANLTYGSKYAHNFFSRIHSLISYKWNCITLFVFYVSNATTISFSNLSHHMCGCFSPT